MWCPDGKKVPRKFAAKAVHGADIRSGGGSGGGAAAAAGAGAGGGEDNAETSRDAAKVRGGGGGGRSGGGDGRAGEGERERDGEVRGGGCTQFVHDRGPMIVDPRIPTMPGRSTSGFTNQADIACTKRGAP